MIPFGFWKSADDGFRYLHDEISGGVEAFSKLKSKELYTGSCVTIPSSGTDYGFVNNIVDFAEIDATQASNNTYLWYNQLDISQTITSATTEGYLKASNNFSFIGEFQNNAISYLTDFSRPFTAYIVFERLSAPANFIRHYTFQDSSPVSLYNILEQLNTGVFRTRMTDAFTGGSRVVIVATNTSFTSLKQYIVCVTYNGNLTNSGINIYVDDLVTAQSLTNVSVGTLGSGPNGLNQRFTNYNNSEISTEIRLDELHLFDSVHNQTQRETAKEILEQHYTFS